MEKEFIYDQHQKHQDWLSRLDFYKEEIQILKERLQEITSKNNSSEVLVDVEHFQNQFIVQRNNIDELAHSIKVHEAKIVKEIESNPVAVEHRKMEAHEEEEDFMTYFEKNFSELRETYNRFAAKWM
jgi:hypothetical protein